MTDVERRQANIEFLQKLKDDCKKRPPEECKDCVLYTACSLSFGSLRDEQIKNIVDVVMG